MSTFSEYGELGAVDVLVVVVDEEVVVDAASASCKLGTTARERIRITTRRDRDFMKTLEAASLRY